MTPDNVDRRTVVAGAATVGASGLMPNPLFAQATPPAASGVGSAPTSLPTRGEFVIRGAHVSLHETGRAHATDAHLTLGGGAATAFGVRRSHSNRVTDN